MHEKFIMLRLSEEEQKWMDIAAENTSEGTAGVRRAASDKVCVLLLLCARMCGAAARLLFRICSQLWRADTAGQRLPMCGAAARPRSASEAASHPG